jgi:hypothetical protein
MNTKCFHWKANTFNIEALYSPNTNESSLNKSSFFHDDAPYFSLAWWKYCACLVHFPPRIVALLAVVNADHLGVNLVQSGVMFAQCGGHVQVFAQCGGHVQVRFQVFFINVFVEYLAEAMNVFKPLQITQLNVGYVRDRVHGPVPGLVTVQQEKGPSRTSFWVWVSVLVASLGFFLLFDMVLCACVRVCEQRRARVSTMVTNRCGFFCSFY